VHLSELLALGTRPGAGLLIALTARCPLSCAHCSTDSSMDSVQYSDEPLRRLTSTFMPQARPDAVLMSGGEPLLRPELVAQILADCGRTGSRSALISGMFFARGGRALPPPISAALTGLDHFAASTDREHEREVDREDVFAALTAVLDRVPAASLHITTTPPRDGRPDSYVDTLVADVRRRFGARLPMLVSAVQPTGRAARAADRPGKRLATGADSEHTTTAAPCEFAGWPLVDHDGTVYACTRQSLLRDSRAAHLVLGHAARDAWPVLHHRALAEPLLRAVRTMGPRAARERFAAPPAAPCPADACTACLGLTEAGAAPGAARYLDSAGGRLVEAAVLGLSAARPPHRVMAARGGLRQYAELVELGWGELCEDR
jgi:pyruvate-formate lyase-activating enzyme